MKSVSDIKRQELLKKRRERIIMSVAGMLAILLCVLEYYLISKAGPLPAGSNILIFTVININILLILTLCFLVIRKIVKIIFEEKSRMLGARLRTRLVAAFIFLSLIPTMLLFFVSLYFLKTSLAYWFDSRVAEALENAVIIGQNYYDEQTAITRDEAASLARTISRRCIPDNGDIDTRCTDNLMSGTSMLFQNMNNIQRLHFIKIIDHNGMTLWETTRLPLLRTPPPIDSSALRTILDSKSPSDSLVTTQMENGELVRIIVPLGSYTSDRRLFLVAGTLLSHNVSELLENIKKGYEEYNQFRLFQDPIKATLIITLFLITLLIMFVAIWFGLRIAKGITEPVQMLADATHRIAQGDLDFSLEVHGRDELSGLVQAFNTMTRDLKEARRIAEDASRNLQESYREIEHSRAYMEILLHSITAGVISIDMQGNVTTINRAASELLGIDSTDIINRNYSVILDRNQMKEFENIRRDLFMSGKGVLQRHIVMERKNVKLSLLVNFAILKDQDNNPLGVIIVFDDLTEIEKIQRMAAWREVARRIAHEVKNPLTPIKLSAQRLKKKYGDRFDGDERAIFIRCTETITGQVDELGRLVNEFSKFARSPSPRFSEVDITEIAGEVIDLYSGTTPGINFSIMHSGPIPKLHLDRDQIKRVLINLIDNAISVMPDGGAITVKTVHDAASGKVKLSISDTGPGIREQDRTHLFEPYFSRKRGGTGLGLAIVNSIISDHNGKIYLEENTENGATFVIEFPEHSGGEK